MWHVVPVQGLEGYVWWIEFLPPFLKYMMYRFSEESNHQANMFPQLKCRNRPLRKFFTLLSWRREFYSRTKECTQAVDRVVVGRWCLTVVNIVVIYTER